MKILALTPQLPYPPMQGTSLRNFYLLRESSRRHEIALLTLLQPGDQLAERSPLHTFCRTIRTVPAPPRRSLAQRARSTLTSPLPDMGLRLASGAFAAALREWLACETFDLIQVEGIEMAPYGLDRRRAAARPRLVFDDHNAEYVLQRSAFQADIRQPARWHGAFYSFIQWQKLVRYERRVLLAHDAAAAVSDTDARALHAIAPEREIVVVPNGVDTDEFAPAAAPQVAEPTLPAEAIDLVFTGKMDYRPNVDAALWFGLEILPLIRAQLPHVRFVVVGQQPHARLAPLAARGDTVLTGWVPDVKPYIAKAAVYVAPLRMGGGTRLKVLQAMSMAVPIVSTTLGCDGLSVQDGREVALADSPRAFADAVVRLARDAALRRSLGANARQLAVAQYDWRRIGPRMELLYEYRKPGAEP